jgi:carboxymethylenebutenolidase
MMAQRVAFSIDGVATTGLAAFPGGSAGVPGVVVTFHRGGLDEFTEWMVDDLAVQGFAAFAPDHFHVLPPDKTPDDRNAFMTDEQLARDLAAAARWLGAQERVIGDRLAIMGPCMGGRNAIVAAECHPELWRCVCAWYGGNLFKPLIGSLPAPGERERLARLACPVEGYFGDLDVNPSPADVDRLDALLSALGKPHVFHRYAGCHHGFLNRFTGRPGHYDGAAAVDSWRRAMRFLAQHLGAPAAVG